MMIMTMISSMGYVAFTAFSSNPLMPNGYTGRSYTFVDIYNTRSII